MKKTISKKIFNYLIRYIDGLDVGEQFIVSDIKKILSSPEYNYHLKFKDLKNSINLCMELFDDIGIIALSFSFDKTTYPKYDIIYDENKKAKLYYCIEKLDFLYLNYLTMEESKKMIKNYDYKKTFERKCKLKQIRK